jgi:hypothetical protein
MAMAAVLSFNPLVIHVPLEAYSAMAELSKSCVPDPVSSAPAWLNR